MVTIPGRIPIQISPIFWFLILFIGWVNSNEVSHIALWAIVAFFSVLIHEYGHALTALFFGQKAQIQLVALGGLTLRSGNKLSAWKEFIIVLNGPLAGFGLFAISYLVLHQIGENRGLLSYFFMISMYANLFWTILNLLPIHPLDGGKLISIVLQGLFGIKGLQFSLLLSCLLGLGMSLLFFLSHSLLMGSLFLMMVFEGYQAWRASLGMTSQDHNEELKALLKESEVSLQKEDLELAQQQLEQIRELSKQGIIYETASEYLAALLSRRQQYEEAYHVLLPLKKGLSADAVLLLHQLAYCNRDWKEVVAIGDRAYQLRSNYETAVLNAIGYAALGQEMPSIGWLQCAVRDGISNLQDLVRIPEFHSIRLLPAFQEFLERNRHGQT